ncbi:unnamed protein product [Alopecurus aequalis]
MLLRSGRRVATGDEAARAIGSRRRCRAKPDQLSGFPEEILQEILGVDDWFPAMEAVHLRGAEIRPVFGFPDLFHYPLTVDASCDGLFVTGNYICNPATRQWAPLASNPRRRLGSLVGLYRHQPSGEYRVLYFICPNAPLPTLILPTTIICPNEYRVLTVGTNEPRRVDCPLTELVGGRGPILCGAPVILNGSLHVHWKNRSASTRYHKILVFDTVAESFRHMIPPAVDPRHAMHLLDMGGTLAVATSKDTVTMSIFGLQDQPQQDVWAFQYRIKLPVVDIRRFQEQGDWWAKVVSGEGDVLVSCYGQLLHCDKGGNLVANFKFDDEIPVVDPHRLKESLIQHAFFEKKTKN